MVHLSRSFLGLALGALATAGVASAQLRGTVVQAPEGEAAWYGVSGSETLCVFSLRAENETCWPSLGGQLTDLRALEDGFLAAGYASQDGVTELFLVRGGGGRVEPLTVPPSSGVPRGRPQIVIGSDRLLGLLWLAGETQRELELHSAEWLGTSWSEVAVVSPRGPGSQVAPAVTTLRDGRWLAVWTAYDGHDDETSWSLFDGRRWSPPRRLHDENESPDITPAVVTTRSGAVAAWSTFDGHDYRIRTAFFDDRGWRLVDHQSGRGATDPQFQQRGGLLLLSYRTVIPDEWVFGELDTTGVELRRAIVSSSNAYRPAVRWGDGGVRLQWHDLDGDSAIATWGPSR